MNYEKMSDIELSKELIRVTGGALPCDTASVCCAGMNYIGAGSWSHVGPLLVEYEITVLFYDEYVEVSYEFDGEESIHGTDETLTYHISGDKKDVLRLIIICILTKIKASK